jgi:hypothetical protein
MKTILQYIGLLLLLILSFLGANYLLSGDTIISGSISLVLVILIYFLIEFLKNRKVQITKSKFSGVSFLLWGLFVVLCIPIGILITHALNVEINAKKELKSYANAIVAKNQDAINLFQTENKQYIQETYLIARNALDRYVNTSNKTEKDSIEALLGDVRFGITEFQQINKSNFSNSANALQSALEIQSAAVLDSIQDRSKTTIKNNVYLVDKWSRLRLVSAISELENMLEKNINQMNAFLTHQNYKPNVFSNPDNPGAEVLSFVESANNQLKVNKSDVNLASFSGLWKQYAPYWLLIPVFIFFFLLILPYVLEQTSGKYTVQDDKDIETGGIEI